MYKPADAQVPFKGDSEAEVELEVKKVGGIEVLEISATKIDGASPVKLTNFPG